MSDNTFDFTFEFDSFDDCVDIEDIEMDEWRRSEGVNLFFLLDTSGSMSGQRIEQLNAAMPIALNAAREAAAEAEVDIYVRIISFNSVANWVMGCTEQGVDIYTACNSWQDLSCGGATDIAGAIRLANTAMHTKYMGTRDYHPVVILVTDGESNNRSDTQNAIEEMRMALTGGDINKKDKVWRFAIGVEGYNEAELNDFAMEGTREDEFGNEETGVPMVFKIEDDITELFNVIRGVTVDSLLPSLNVDPDNINGLPIIDI